MAEREMPTVLSAGALTEMYVRRAVETMATVGEPGVQRTYAMKEAFMWLAKAMSPSLREREDFPELEGATIL